MTPHEPLSSRNSQLTLTQLLISAGGNDALLSDILDHCIFGWRAPSYSVSSCESTLEKVSDIITDTLPGALDALITAAKTKLTPRTGRIYYTAYAQFFDQDDAQCDSVKWNFWPDPFGNAQPLDAARRTTLNGLTVDVNNAIQAAVARAGDQVVYVNYDQYFTGFTGRFCESGITEPAPDRGDLLFYQRKTQDLILPWKRQAPTLPMTNTSAPINAAAANPLAAANTDNVIAKGTFEGDIALRISQTLAQNPAWIIALEDDAFQVLTVDSIPSDGSSPHILSASAPTNNTAIARRGTGDTIAWLLPDSMKRVFHPKPNGHAYIASLVLYHMEAENAKIQGGFSSSTMSDLLDDWTEIAPALACPLQIPDLPLAAAIAAENSTSGSSVLSVSSAPSVLLSTVSAVPTPPASPIPSGPAFGAPTPVNPNQLNKYGAETS